MGDQAFIPSNGIVGLYLDVFNMNWYMHDSSIFNIQKEIPLMKLLLDMASLRMRYYLHLNGNRLLLPQTIINIGHTSAILVRTFTTIPSLSEDLFCRGDIETVDCCMKVYRQYWNKEPLDFFISDAWEIDYGLQKMESELFKFSECLGKLFKLFYSLFPKKLKFRKDLNDTKLLFKRDLMKPFEKFIIKECKYSSGTFGKIKGLFLEKMKYKCFFNKFFFKDKKN